MRMFINVHCIAVHKIQYIVLRLLTVGPVMQSKLEMQKTAKAQVITFIKKKRLVDRQYCIKARED